MCSRRSPIYWNIVYTSIFSEREREREAGRQADRQADREEEIMGASPPTRGPPLAGCRRRTRHHTPTRLPAQTHTHSPPGGRRPPLRAPSRRRAGQPFRGLMVRSLIAGLFAPGLPASFHCRFSLSLHLSLSLSLSLSSDGPLPDGGRRSTSFHCPAPAAKSSPAPAPGARWGHGVGRHSRLR